MDSAYPVVPGDILQSFLLERTESLNTRRGRFQIFLLLFTNVDLVALQVCIGLPGFTGAARLHSQ